eukprot:snap_masked-scaffold_7-processed-gene-10.55-mRNA-1 protein AED:1.00 eAED:1.00 QI:0/-1/0/0/-1/1/1/0/107
MTNFEDEIISMVYGFGGCTTHIKETTEMLDGLAQDYMKILIYDCLDALGSNLEKRGDVEKLKSLDAEVLKFVLRTRGDSEQENRVIELQKDFKEITKQRKQNLRDGA